MENHRSTNTRSTPPPKRKKGLPSGRPSTPPCPLRTRGQNHQLRSFLPRRTAHLGGEACSGSVQGRKQRAIPKGNLKAKMWGGWYTFQKGNVGSRCFFKNYVCKDCPHRARLDCGKRHRSNKKGTPIDSCNFNFFKWNVGR